MRPRSFDYVAPPCIDEALAALEGDIEVRALAGGQSLIPMMNFRLARPERVVDLRKLSELRRVVIEERRVVLGAMTTHLELERSPELSAKLPILAAAAQHIGHPAIRNRGTIGGSLAHADAAAEWPVVATALDAELSLASRRGERTVPARDFFVGDFTTLIEQDELLTSVAMPALEPHAGWSFKEFMRQHRAFALALVAVVAELDPEGHIGKLVVALGGVDSAPVLADTRQFIGEPASEGLIAEAAHVVADALRPPSDLHATGEDRKSIARALVKRGLTEALLGAGAMELDSEERA
jgi:aerobic carbon-monoxide dehydrogenase medium subunit